MPCDPSQSKGYPFFHPGARKPPQAKTAGPDANLTPFSFSLLLAYFSSSSPKQFQQGGDTSGGRPYRGQTPGDHRPPRRAEAGGRGRRALRRRTARRLRQREPAGVARCNAAGRLGRALQAGPGVNPVPLAVIRRFPNCGSGCCTIQRLHGALEFPAKAGVLVRFRPANNDAGRLRDRPPCPRRAASGPQRTPLGWLSKSAR